MKKLYLSRKDRKLAGVVGGVGEYFDIDPTILRVLWVFIVVFTGILPGVLVYIIVWAIMPEKPQKGKKEGVKIADTPTEPPTQGEDSSSG